MLKTLVSVLFGLALFINALFFIPQAIRIWRNKTAQDVSLTMFLGFWAIQIIAVLYGYLDNDYILLYGYLLSVISCGTVIFLILFYRNKNKHHKLNL